MNAVGRVSALRKLTSDEARELLILIERIAAMDITNTQAALLARNEARDAIAKVVSNQTESHRRKHPAVDPKSFELAEHFLSDQEWHDASEDQKWELAGVIQQAVEDWLDGHAP